MEEVCDRTDGQQKKSRSDNYLRRLIAELQRRRFQRAANVCVRASAVKMAADVSMAMAARGRTAWSRAILEKKMSPVRDKAKKKAKRFLNRWKFLKSRSFRTLRRSCNGVSSSSSSSFSSSPVSVSPPLNDLSSRIRTLRTLIPGGRGLETPVLLEEVADYILALKTQVESMKALADVLENSS